MSEFARFFTPSVGFALLAIALWGTLAALGTKLGHLPPFFLVGVGLGIGGFVGLPFLLKMSRLTTPLPIYFFGGLGIFAYHFFLFESFRYAPAVEANLLNYLWPILLVLLTPLFFREFKLRLGHIIGGALALTGAFVCMSGGALEFHLENFSGYGLASGAAVTWAIYSLWLKKQRGLSTASVSVFCFVASFLSLIVHALLETFPTLAPSDFGMLAVLGVGPMGVAFYAWDASLKKGDPRLIGALSYLTPVLSTTLLGIALGGNAVSGKIIVALGLIVGGAVASQWLSKDRSDSY